MDIIGSIQLIENRLGGYTPRQGKSKPLPKVSRHQHDAYPKSNHNDDSLSTAEQDSQLGRNIDTTA